MGADSDAGDDESDYMGDLEAVEQEGGHKYNGHHRQEYRYRLGDERNSR